MKHTKAFSNLITFSPKGLYCQAGDLSINPVGRVQSAVLTHAHAAHVRIGANQDICHHQWLIAIK